VKKATARRLRTGWSGSVRRMTKGTIPTTAPAADRYDLHDVSPPLPKGRNLNIVEKTICNWRTSRHRHRNMVVILLFYI
jgi:hypothetical protein